MCVEVVVVANKASNSIPGTSGAASQHSGHAVAVDALGEEGMSLLTLSYAW